ncbi:MAG TPA: hypothetical protein VKV73_25770 [Chloroflexota bacterium]|nr:hypothetical protein [Chloroflexota bacterium]
MFLEFMRSTLGTAVLVLCAIVVVALLLWWARTRGHPERVLVFGASAVLSLVLGILYMVAVTAGWWTGEYFQMPFLAQAGAFIAVTLLGCTVWLAGYGWLSEHTSRPVWAYIGVSLLLVVAVAVAHVFNVGRGTILVGPAWTIVVDAVVAQLLLWVPVLMYEALRRTLQSSELGP